MIVYYAGLDGDWDDDGDGIYGEISFDCALGVDEGDWCPDVCLGRIPCTTVSELNMYLKRLLATDYSKLTISDINTLQVGCMVDSTITDIRVPGKILHDEDLPYESMTCAAITRELTEGFYPLFFFTGHGNRTGLGATDGLWMPCALGESGATFFAFIAGCETGYTDWSNDSSDRSVPQELLFKSGSGALGCVAASRLSSPIQCELSDTVRHILL